MLPSPALGKPPAAEVAPDPAGGSCCQGSTRLCTKALNKEFPSLTCPVDKRIGSMLV